MDAPRLAVLENLPSHPSLFRRLTNTSIVDHDPTVEPPKKSARLPGQQSPSARASAKGKGKARDLGGEIALSSKPRVFRVHSMSEQADLPLHYTTKLGGLIKRAINEILDPTAGAIAGLSFEQTYQACHVLVARQNQGADVYAQLKLALEKCASTTMADIRRNEDFRGVTWLKLLVNKWQWYEERLSVLRAVLVHLDTLYAAPSQGAVIQILDLGRDIWRSHFSSTNDYYGVYASRIERAIKEWVMKERDELFNSASTSDAMPVDNNDRATIKLFIELATLTRIYREFFMIPYEEYTGGYFLNEYGRLNAALSPSAYFQHVVRRVEQETQRLKDCCPDAPWDGVLTVVDNRLIGPKLQDEKFLLQVISTFMQTNNSRWMNELYKCYGRLNYLPFLRTVFRVHVENAVEKFTADVSNDATMISSLVGYKASVDSIVSKAFVPSSDYQFNDAVKEAFTRGLAARKKKPAELLAKYLDAELRRGQQGSSDKEFQEKIDAALVLHNFLSDHDVFRIYFMRLLAKRLLLRRSASDDFEKNFLTKLGREVDPEFLNGLQMFEDLNRSHSLVSGFHELHPKDSHFTANVFQRSIWPTYPPSPVTLPTDMQDSVNRFSAYYEDVSKKQKKLEWVNTLGTVTLRARFPKGEKELAVSLFQGIVLLLFNDTDVLHVRDVREQTGLENDELTRTIQSLALGKKRVLNKDPTSKEVNDSDKISFNPDFEDKSRNVRINTIQVQETAQEAKATEKEVDGGRDFLLDAAIVRIMKGAKKLGHEELLNNVIKAVEKSFQAQPRFFKKRVEQMIEQDYIRRDDNDSNVYHYVA